MTFVEEFTEVNTSLVERWRIAFLIALSLVGIVFLWMFAVPAFAQGTSAPWYPQVFLYQQTLSHNTLALGRT